MIYPLIRSFLFRIDPEKAHYITLKALNAFSRLKLTQHFIKPINHPQNVMGLHFPNQVGLAAGLDKNGDYIEGLGALGFGHIEIGTVTPKAQEGNPKPRLFRIPEAQALINRMGFNNRGVDYLLSQLTKINYKGILGINIGKNAITPLEKAIDDYTECFQKVYPHASYITINISSPNTPGLRNLQKGEFLENILLTLKQMQTSFTQTHKKYVPLVIKISPDITNDEIQQMANAFIRNNVDGIIISNTTLSRQGVENFKYGNEQGGLSGRPLFDLSTQVLKKFYDETAGKIPLIASGGIMTANDAKIKLESGASLVQIYTGLIYSGLQLVQEIANMLPLPHAGEGRVRVTNIDKK